MSGTTNLGIPYIQASQNQKEVTANAAFDALDKALTETFDANLASANVTLTDAQYRQALAVRAQNATVAGRTVTLPARERLTVLVMDGSCTQEVGFVRGSTTLSLAPGQAVLARTDGSTNGLVALIRGSAATPVSTFLALADTPASYAGQGGRALRVNAGGTALEFTDVAAASHTHDAGDITGGTVDTARFGSGTADASTFLRGDQAWVAPTLAGLSDGPGGLSVAPGQLLQVNAGGTAVEFGLLHNMAATTDPGAADDIGDGYAIGSIGFNRARDPLWLGLDASAGAASCEPRVYLSVPPRPAWGIRHRSRSGDGERPAEWHERCRRHCGGPALSQTVPMVWRPQHRSAVRPGHDRRHRVEHQVRTVGPRLWRRAPDRPAARCQQHAAEHGHHGHQVGRHPRGGSGAGHSLGRQHP